MTFNESFFQGHFPGEPVMPGVLIVEALAQAGSIPLLKLDSFKGKTAYLGGLNNVKFRQKVTPGDVLTLQVDIVKLKDMQESVKALLMSMVRKSQKLN